MGKLSELREAERYFCKNDIEYFIDKYGHIEDKDAEELIQPFQMWGEQRNALRSIMGHRLNVILKARQLGFSWLACHIVAHLIVTSSGKTAIGLSKSEEEAKELIRRVGVILRYMPELVAEKDFVPNGWDGPIFVQNALNITVKYPDNTESTFKGLASSPGAGRSFTANIIVFDEWAFQNFADEIWTGGFPTINRPNGGKVIGLSTIERGSLFEKLFTDPDNGFNKIFIPWYADPRRDKEWYERTKLALGDAITAEYPATIEEALMVPGGAFFPEVTKKTHEVDKLPSECGENVKRVCAIDYGLDALAAVFAEIDKKGNCTVYRSFKFPDLTVSQASAKLLSASAYEHIDMWLAPNDLNKRNNVDGKSAFDLFIENGINFIPVERDFVQGCILMKEALAVPSDDSKPKLTFLKGSSDNLIKDMQKIQKDKNKPIVYSKTPHELTHFCDSLRYLCVYWLPKAKEEKPKQKKKRWSKDLIYDYRHATREIRELMEEQLGKPVY